MLPLVLSVLIPYHLEGLDHPRYRVRAAHHQWLTKVGRLAFPALRSYRPRSPEGQRRKELLLEPYRLEIADEASHTLLPDGWYQHPYLPSGEAYKPYRTLEKGIDWVYNREDTRRWVKAMLVQRRPRRWIIEQLNTMAWNEVMWCRWQGVQAPTPPGKPGKGTQRKGKGR